MICSNISSTTRYVDTFKLARVLRTASHDIIHEARLVVNDVATGGGDRKATLKNFVKIFMDPDQQNANFVCVRDDARGKGSTAR